MSVSKRIQRTNTEGACVKCKDSFLNADHYKPVMKSGKNILQSYKILLHLNSSFHWVSEMCCLRSFSSSPQNTVMLSPGRRKLLSKPVRIFEMLWSFDKFSSFWFSASDRAFYFMSHTVVTDTDQMFGILDIWNVSYSCTLVIIFSTDSVFHSSLQSGDF